MLKTKFQINIVLIVTILMAQVSIAFAAPPLETQPEVQPAPAQAGATGWIVSCNYSHSLNDDPIVRIGSRRGGVSGRVDALAERHHRARARHERGLHSVGEMVVVAGEEVAGRGVERTS